MAANSVYRITELVGTSKKSWEDAAANAVNTASKTLRDLRVAEVIKLDMVVEDGKVAAYRARVALSFKYDSKSK
jgi:dodecin